MRYAQPLRFVRGFTVVGLAHWFFGNLYETVVLMPNNLTDPATALTYWNAYTRVSTPVWYFIPMSPLTLLASAVAYGLGRTGPASLQRALRLTLLLTTVATALTVYLVTQINLTVFFSGLDLMANRERIDALIWRGVPVGLARLVVVGVGLYRAVKAHNLCLGKL